MNLVQETGHSWKEIAHALNGKYVDDGEIGHKFGRTPENVKDKWKQLGGENSEYRQRGPWSLEEAMQLLALICKATEAKLLKSSVEIKYSYQDEDLSSSESRKKHKKRFVIKGEANEEEDENSKKEIIIYNRNVTVEEIVPLVIKKNRCKNLVP